MAQILEEFENEIEPRLPEKVASDFKVLVRRKVSALATDCTQIMELDADQEVNGAALAVRDSLSPDSAIQATTGGRSR